MRKNLVMLLVVSLVFLCACAAPASIENTTAPTASFDVSKWSEYSDYELMELTINSEENKFRQLSAVWMTAEEWKAYMLENCEPFQALMLRGSAMKSLEEHSAALVEQYRGEVGELSAENFLLLVMTVHPPMQEQLKEFEITFLPRTDT